MSLDKVKKKGIEFFIAFNRFRRKENVHFLHIGKTDGTAIKSAFGNKKFKGFNKYLFVFHGHEVRLMDITDKDFVFFIVRNPISRFVS